MRDVAGDLLLNIDVNAIKVLHEDLGLALAQLVHLRAHLNPLVEDAFGFLEELVEHLRSRLDDGNSFLV